MANSTTMAPAPSASSNDPRGLAPLLAGAVAGDRAALEALLAKLRPYMHALVRSRLGSDFAGPLDQSALVQEGLIRIYRNIGRLRNQSVPHLLGWTGQIVRHLLVDALRAGQREPGKIRDAAVLNQLVRNRAGEEDARDERLLRVAAAMDKLDNRRRQVIEMYFLDQLSDAEICSRLGGNVGAIRVLRFRALEDLRRLLETGDQT